MKTLRHETHVALRRELADLEHRWASAVLERDRPILERLLSDHVVIVTVNGKVGHGRKAALQHLLDPALRGIEVTQTDVRVLGPEAALVTGRAVLDLQSDGEALARSIHYTRVWQQRNDRWKIVAAHASPLSS